MTSQREVLTQIPIIYLPPQELIPYEHNAKVHSKTQIAAIADQISNFGWDQPIVVDKNRVIIKGHGRREAALHLGLPKVPVVLKEHLKEWEVKAARLADNKVAEAPWDVEKLKIDFGSFQGVEGVRFELTGFNLPQITELLNPPTAESIFSDAARTSPKDRDYEGSDVRQIVLVMDPDTFEQVLGRFEKLQGDMGVETNLDVVLRLLDFYDQGKH